MIESVDDFRSRLTEIHTLIAYARANTRNLDKYKLFNKTAIVLLCSHFEVFVEAFIAEHVDVIRACYQSGTIPQYMKDNYIDDTIKALKGLSNPSKKQKPLKALFKLHDSTSVNMTAINDLELDMKYSFGKHGQEDTERLFNKFGFGDFVNSSSFQDPFKKINSAISIRNNIIHEGSAPTLSHADVIIYMNEFLVFADGLEHYILNNQLDYYGKLYYHLCPFLLQDAADAG